jgi:hypothetical protein
MLFRNFDKFQDIYRSVSEIEKKIIKDEDIWKKKEQDAKDLLEGN